MVGSRVLQAGDSLSAAEAAMLGQAECDRLIAVKAFRRVGEQKPEPQKQGK